MPQTITRAQDLTVMQASTLAKCLVNPNAYAWLGHLYGGGRAHYIGIGAEVMKFRGNDWPAAFQAAGIYIHDELQEPAHA